MKRTRLSEETTLTTLNEETAPPHTTIIKIPHRTTTTTTTTTTTLPLTVFTAQKGNLNALARYWKKFLTKDQADNLFNVMMQESTKYTQDKVSTPGGKKDAPRLTCTYGPEGAVYKYAGMTRLPVSVWPPELKNCK
jgi:hypothetical protein